MTADTVAIEDPDVLRARSRDVTACDQLLALLAQHHPKMNRAAPLATAATAQKLKEDVDNEYNNKRDELAQD